MFFLSSLRSRVLLSGLLFVYLFLIANLAMAKPKAGRDQRPEAAAQRKSDIVDLSRLFILPKATKNTPTAEKLPRYIAVLPVAGKGSVQQRHDVRLAFHNVLGASRFDMARPAAVDAQLRRFHISQSKATELLAPEELARRLKVDGLLYVELPTLDKFYAAAYAHYKVAVELKLYSLEHNALIWQYRDEETEREGGIATNPLSLIATAFTSSQVLTEAVRQQLTDTLARRFADKVPQPSELASKPKPPQIFSALSNAGEGPFHQGSEVRVLLRAEPGLEASFQLSHSEQRYPLKEVQAAAKGTEGGEAEYTGRYVVARGDDHRDSHIRVWVSRHREAEMEWRVPGLLSLDTLAPAPVEQLTSIAQRQDVHLHWRAAAGGEPSQYLLERAHKRQFSELARVELQHFRDDTITPGRAYRYRVTVLDAAGNRSEARVVDVETLRYGPTDIDADIERNTYLRAAGSPYRIKGKVRVLKDVTLRIEAGSVFELDQSSQLEVLGRIKAEGKAASPIVIKGQGWRIQHRFNVGVRSRYTHVRFIGRDEQGPNTHLPDGAEAAPLLASFVVDDSRVQLRHCIFHRAQLTLIRGAASVEDCSFEAATTAVRVQAGRMKITRSVFDNNELAIENLGGDLQLEALSFAENLRHIDSFEPLTLGSVRFLNDDFDSLGTRLTEAVSVPWKQLPAVDNLRAQWQQRQWLQVADGIEQGRWLEARQRLLPLLGHALPEEEPALNDLAETLYLLQNPLAAAAPLQQSPLFGQVLELRARGQRAGLSWLPVTEIRDFTKAYLQHFYAKTLAEGVLTEQTIDLQDAILGLYPLPVAVQDERVGSLFLLDVTQLEKKLRAAGFIRLPPLLNRLELVRPRHRQLCQARSPWVMGARPIGVRDALRASDCVSLRLAAAEDLQLYLLAQGPGGELIRLLPDGCARTGLLSNRLRPQQQLALPQTPNQQPGVASLRAWPYVHYYAVALASTAAEDFIRPLLDAAQVPCQPGARTVMSAESVRQKLQQADIRSGGQVQWRSAEFLLR